MMYAWTALIAGAAVAAAFVPVPIALAGFGIGVVVLVILVRRPARTESATVRSLRTGTGG